MESRKWIHALSKPYLGAVFFGSLRPSLDGVLGGSRDDRTPEREPRKPLYYRPLPNRLKSNSSKQPKKSSPNAT